MNSSRTHARLRPTTRDAVESCAAVRGARAPGRVARRGAAAGLAEPRVRVSIGAGAGAARCAARLARIRRTRRVRQCGERRAAVAAATTRRATIVQQQRRVRLRRRRCAAAAVRLRARTLWIRGRAMRSHDSPRRRWRSVTAKQRWVMAQRTVRTCFVIHRAGWAVAPQAASLQADGGVETLVGVRTAVRMM
jgi:hypothetical protein